MNFTNLKKAIFIGMIVAGIYDFGCFVIKGEASTISRVMSDYFLVGELGKAVIFMILGHWLWPMAVTKEGAK